MTNYTNNKYFKKLEETPPQDNVEKKSNLVYFVVGIFLLICLVSLI